MVVGETEQDKEGGKKLWGLLQQEERLRKKVYRATHLATRERVASNGKMIDRSTKEEGTQKKSLLQAKEGEVCPKKERKNRGWYCGEGGGGWGGCGVGGGGWGGGGGGGGGVGGFGGVLGFGVELWRSQMNPQKTPYQDTKKHKK